MHPPDAGDDRRKVIPQDEFRGADPHDRSGLAPDGRLDFPEMIEEGPHVSEKPLAIWRQPEGFALEEPRAKALLEPQHLGAYRRLSDPIRHVAGRGTDSAPPRHVVENLELPHVHNRGRAQQTPAAAGTQRSFMRSMDRIAFID